MEEGTRRALLEVERRGREGSLRVDCRVTILAGRYLVLPCV